MGLDGGLRLIREGCIRVGISNTGPHFIKLRLYDSEAFNIGELESSNLHLKGFYKFPSLTNQNRSSKAQY